MAISMTQAEGSQNWPLERWDYEGEPAWKDTPKATLGGTVILPVPGSVFAFLGVVLVRGGAFRISSELKSH